MENNEGVYENEIELKTINKKHDILKSRSEKNNGKTLKIASISHSVLLLIVIALVLALLLMTSRLQIQSANLKKDVEKFLKEHDCSQLLRKLKTIENEIKVPDAKTEQNVTSLESSRFTVSIPRVKSTEATPNFNPTINFNSSASRKPVKACRSGWTKASNGLCYKYFGKNPVDYKAAKFRCSRVGARLAAAGLRTAALRSQVKPLIPTNPFPSTWIGLDDLATQGTYVWSDGVISTRQNTDWQRAEPNEPQQRCAAMHAYHRGLVADIECRSTFYYICEMAA